MDGENNKLLVSTQAVTMKVPAELEMTKLPKMQW